MEVSILVYLQYIRGFFVFVLPWGSYERISSPTLDAKCPKSFQLRPSQYIVAVVWTFPSTSCQTLALQFLSLLNSIKEDVVIMNAYEQG